MVNNEKVYKPKIHELPMGSSLGKTSHSVHLLSYHLIQCVSGAKRIFENKKIVDLLLTQIHKISKTFKIEVLEIEYDYDYFHMIFKAKPTLDIPRYLNAIKCITSREIQRNFSEDTKGIKKGRFWSRSYFLATSGQVTTEVLKNYIDMQRKNEP
jgi:putative transposase